MFRVFQEEKLITICMFAFLGNSILLRVILGLLYRNMIKEADNMAVTKNRLLKQCKTKFASCYQLGNGVANIPVFVDKFLNRMALGHLSFETLYQLSGQLMLLSVVFSGIGVCKSIIGGRTVGDVLPFYIVSFFGLYVYFSVSTVVDIRGKKRMLKVNLVDYLENHLSPRIDVTRQDMEMLYGDAAFEEKRGIERGTTGSGSRARGKKAGKRAVQPRPEKRRTVELMPIGSRMASGGEPFMSEPAPGAAYQRQAVQTPELPQAEPGRQDVGRQASPAEWGQQEMRQASSEDWGQQEMRQASSEDWGQQPTQEQSVGWEQQQAQGQTRIQAQVPAAEWEQPRAQARTRVQEWEQQQAQAQTRAQAQVPAAEWEQQAQEVKPQLQEQVHQRRPAEATQKENSDDSAVTAEELEALLKEFLTT